MALWAMTPRGTRVQVIPAHRACAASMTEDAPSPQRKWTHTQLPTIRQCPRRLNGE